MRCHFFLGDDASVARMSRTPKGAENSAGGYVWFLGLALERHGGVMTASEIEAEFLRHYERSFGPDDKRLIRVGKHGRQPKWKNALAWAKVIGIKLRLWWRRERDGEMVFVGGTAPARMRRWVFSGKKEKIKRSFCRMCECKAWNPVTASACWRCGHYWGEVRRRVVRYPVA